MTDLVERLRAHSLGPRMHLPDGGLTAEAADEIERLRAALTRLTTDITSSAAAMDAVSLSIFEDALAALGEKP